MSIKKSSQIIMAVIMAAGFILSSCEEEPPFIDFTPEEKDTTLLDTTYVNPVPMVMQEKVVLLEDFTGVGCVNCPEAQQRAKEIQDKFPGRVVVMALHIDPWAKPYPESKYDFRLVSANQVLEMLGGAIGLPLGAIDRKIFPGESKVLVQYQKWESYVQNSLLQTTPIKIDLESEYDNEANEAKIQVIVEYADSVTENNYLSIVILESKIVDAQLTGSGRDLNYVHNHALRRFLTPFDGHRLNANIERGRVFLKEYRVQLDSEWVPDNLSVVAFVHEKINSKKVLQAKEIYLKP